MELKITETVLRDANQSLIATRMTRDQFEDILTEMDKVGYYSIECWGGAIFDSCIRYLDEDPWERLKLFKRKMPNTKKQMLLRGQSLLGYKHYSDDVVRKFVYNAVEKGIDIIRIFDAMNDVKNIEVAVDETIKSGAHPSCAICYTVSPVHNIDSYISLAKQMESIGAQSICIKDMSGILLPSTAFELISKLKDKLHLPVVLHSHCSTGYAYMTYQKAMEAGVDVLDTAVASFSGGTSQPATEVILNVAKDYGREVRLNLDKVTSVNNHFEKVMEEEIIKGTLVTKTLLTRPQTIEDQIPGGMFSNLMSQLKVQNAEKRINEVTREVAEVRRDLGYPPLVTPISQMVGTQATLNVLLGERYKQVIDEVKAYFRGEYGEPPGKVNQELMYKIVGSTKFSIDRMSSKSVPVYEQTKAIAEQEKTSRSDLLTTILFPACGKQFLNKRNGKYTYSVTMASDNEKLKTHMKDATDAVGDDIKAILLAAIAYKTGAFIEDISISQICEME